MHGEYMWKSTLWKRMSRPAILTAVCIFLGVILPAAVNGSRGFLSTLALIVLIFCCPVSLVRAYQAAKLDMGARTVIATVTEIRVSSILVDGSRSRTVFCKAEGHVFSTKTTTEYGNEIIGWKVPVRLSSYDGDVYEVMLDRMSKDYDPDLSGISDFEGLKKQTKNGPAPWVSSAWQDSGMGDAWSYDWGKDGEKGEDERLR